MDYSKWDHIEVSDDEDDTHPNIDTASLFRWRHEARLNRDREWKEEKEKFEKEKKQHFEALQLARSRFSDGKKNNASNLKELEEDLKKLEELDKEWQQKEKEMNKKERLRPLNVDTISHEGRSRTVINKSALKATSGANTDADDSNLHEDAADRLRDFVQKHESEIKKFGMFRRPIDSQQYLLENPYLVCDETANQLVLWCLDLAMEEVGYLILLMFIDPEPEYERMFQAELSAFRVRIRDRAKVKIAEAMQQLEEEERQKRLGPGGLDPLEVLESLPKALKECFETRDVELLKTTLSAMDPKEAEECMKRCIASGLWVENAAEQGAEGDNKVEIESNSAEEDVEPHQSAAPSIP
ncbi:unnamed protein product [Mesocestoides corti]|uniref:Hsp90 chaperone protein kinase-targeting subunit n=1 Tax=Mesocestoides corti TaxID=53468 RepID=A0A0R3U2M1_MESCO|nr:unnamed protein product [Mesocestoides corti]